MPKVFRRYLILVGYINFQHTRNLHERTTTCENLVVKFLDFEHLSRNLTYPEQFRILVSNLLKLTLAISAEKLRALFQDKMTVSQCLMGGESYLN